MDGILLQERLREGYVRRQVHPSLPYYILNYSEKAQYERQWDEVTQQCRGLIVHTETSEVIARPFSKFFNYGEHPEGTFDPRARVEVTDKMDGSLGILIQSSWEIATRGSFTSQQAVWATQWFREYANRDFFNPAYTYLFEIIVKWNRIVVEYDWEGLILIAILETATGHDINLPDDPRLLSARSS